MPILLGLETVALGAAAYKWTSVRDTARDTGSRLYGYLVGDGGRIEVRPADIAVSPGQVSVRPELRPVILPELRAAPDAAARSVLRHREVLETLQDAVPRRFGGACGSESAGASQ